MDREIGEANLDYVHIKVSPAMNSLVEPYFLLEEIVQIVGYNKVERRFS